MNEAAAPKSTIFSGRHTDLSCFACHWSIQTYDCQIKKIWPLDICPVLSKDLNSKKKEYRSWFIYKNLVVIL